MAWRDAIGLAGVDRRGLMVAAPGPGLICPWMPLLAGTSLSSMPVAESVRTPVIVSTAC